MIFLSELLTLQLPSQPSMVGEEGSKPVTGTRTATELGKGLQHKSYEEGAGVVHPGEKEVQGRPYGS